MAGSKTEAAFKWLIGYPALVFLQIMFLIFLLMSVSFYHNLSDSISEFKLHKCQVTSMSLKNVNTGFGSLNKAIIGVNYVHNKKTGSVVYSAQSHTRYNEISYYATSDYIRDRFKIGSVVDCWIKERKIEGEESKVELYRRTLSVPSALIYLSVCLCLVIPLGLTTLRITRYLYRQKYPHLRDMDEDAGFHYYKFKLYRSEYATPLAHFVLFDLAFAITAIIGQIPLLLSTSTFDMIVPLVIIMVVAMLGFVGTSEGMNYEAYKLHPSGAAAVGGGTTALVPSSVRNKLSHRGAKGTRGGRSTTSSVSCKSIDKMARPRGRKGREHKRRMANANDYLWLPPSEFSMYRAACIILHCSLVIVVAGVAVVYMFCRILFGVGHFDVAYCYELLVMTFFLYTRVPHYRAVVRFMDKLYSYALELAPDSDHLGLVMEDSLDVTDNRLEDSQFTIDDDVDDDGEATRSDGSSDGGVGSDNSNDGDDDNLNNIKKSNNSNNSNNNNNSNTTNDSNNGDGNYGLLVDDLGLAMLPAVSPRFDHYIPHVMSLTAGVPAIIFSALEVTSFLFFTIIFVVAATLALASLFFFNRHLTLLALSLYVIAGGLGVVTAIIVLLFHPSSVLASVFILLLIPLLLSIVHLIWVNSESDHYAMLWEQARPEETRRVCGVMWQPLLTTALVLVCVLQMMSLLVAMALAYLSQLTLYFTFWTFAAPLSTFCAVFSINRGTTVFANVSILTNWTLVVVQSLMVGWFHHDGFEGLLEVVLIVLLLVSLELAGMLLLFLLRSDVVGGFKLVVDPHRLASQDSH